MSDKKRNWLVTLLCFGWLVAVLASYHFYNFAYYSEKISVFGRHILSILGV
jgi:hypothetical protein